MPAKKNSTETAKSAAVPVSPAPVPVAAAPVASAAPVPAPAPAVAEASAEVPEVDRFASVLEKLQSFAVDVKELTAIVKGLQKEYNKLKNQKTGRKAKKAAGGSDTKRAPSGFAKPTALSDQLCEFLGLPKGSSLARTEVTRIINQYVKTNNLQDKEDKRKINADAKLKSIMTLNEGDKLTYFNLQSYIKHHFVKA